jgi:hypothetical protein
LLDELPSSLGFRVVHLRLSFLRHGVVPPPCEGTSIQQLEIAC